MKNMPRPLGKLFDACDRGDVVIVALRAVLAECVFASAWRYRLGGRLISSPSVEIDGSATHLDALDRSRNRAD